MTESLPIPNRASLRIVSETGVRHGQRPSATVLCSSRSGADRTLLPAAYVSEKFSEIEKNQGRPIAPSTATKLESQSQRDIRHSLLSSSSRRTQRQGLRTA